MWYDFFLRFHHTGGYIVQQLDCGLGLIVQEGLMVRPIYIPGRFPSKGELCPLYYGAHRRGGPHRCPSCWYKLERLPIHHMGEPWGGIHMMGYGWGCRPLGECRVVGYCGGGIGVGCTM